MRLKFKEGKQKELILLAKGGMTWFNLSKMLGVSEGYLRNELRKEERLLSDKIYDSLCKLSGKNYDKFILERFDDHWGRSKGGTISTGNTKEITIPRYSAKLAELYGIMLGDGCLTSINDKGQGVYLLRIIGDSRLDKTYFDFLVKPLVESLFGIKTKIRKIKNKNTIVLVAQSRKLVDFFEKLGFKSGDKIRNKLDIPEWIRSNPNYLCSCIRGIYDTDGGAYKLPKQNVFQIAFTNHNFILLNRVRDSLFSLNIFPSKITQGKRIYITKKSELRKFLKGIGFNNERHSSKTTTWVLDDSPVV